MVPVSSIKAIAEKRDRQKSDPFLVEVCRKIRVQTRCLRRCFPSIVDRKRRADLRQRREDRRTSPAPPSKLAANLEAARTRASGASAGNGWLRRSRAIDRRRRASAGGWWTAASALLSASATASAERAAARFPPSSWTGAKSCSDTAAKHQRCHEHRAERENQPHSKRKILPHSDYSNFRRGRFLFSNVAK